MTMGISNLLMLPDEMLLEIYKYLLKPHVLYSFFGINQRLNRSIADYFRDICLTDVTFEQLHYLCHSILPVIGSQIYSLSISNCRSVLEGKIFSQYFSDRMAKTFPNLQKLILICFTADELDMFLNTLTSFNNLNEIEIYDLLTDQSNLFQRIIETNNNGFNSIKLKTSCSDLLTSPCLNISNLTISIETLDKLSPLLSSIPKICHLHVTIEQISMMEVSFDQLLPLLYLKYFFLRCYNHFWSLEELHLLFEKVPVVEYMSLQISSEDTRFVNSEQIMFDILPRSIQELNLALRYFYAEVEEIDQKALLASRFPIICLIDDNLQQAFLHTIPYRFHSINISHLMIKGISTHENYRHVKKFYDYQGMTLADALPIVTRCHRIEEVSIQLYDENDELTTAHIQQTLPSLPNLFNLKRIWYLHSSHEYHALKALLQIAPNLSELFIAFDNLLPIFDDHETCQLLQNRIIHLLILRSSPTAPIQLTEQYIPHFVRIFQRLRHLQIDVTNGPLIESIILSVLNAFQHQIQLISLVVEGQSSSDQLKSNARQWLIDHTYLTNDRKFDAEFKKQTNRFLLWM